MKNILVVLALSLPLTVFAAGETKRVCSDKKDKSGNVVKNKEGKPVQECRTIKVHKKVEGEKVPDKK